MQFITQLGMDIGEDGICPFRDVAEQRCRIYDKRPTTCRAYPFTLRKVGEKEYRLAIHNGCPGKGKGEKIVQVEWIERLVD